MSIKPVLAQAPSLGNGILCVARGKTDKGTKIYFYTSVIDDASIQRKRPVAGEHLTFATPKSGFYVKLF
ncbi:hypothetical protein PN472_06325 [Microcystis aeruginosa CS-1036]|uniref:hypothetical protein n=1 Tax=Microcystis aeruginosa TaxID=1126 RepID=UPI0023309EF0|nr:hypothetical protein [Microcystis aeruginosa]MDB9542768.1 hypothetical protein [Microcystis aeruginosa CS-1036]